MIVISSLHCLVFVECWKLFVVEIHWSLAYSFSAATSCYSVMMGKTFIFLNRTVRKSVTYDSVKLDGWPETKKFKLRQIWRTSCANKINRRTTDGTAHLYFRRAGVFHFFFVFGILYVCSA